MAMSQELASIIQEGLPDPDLLRWQQVAEDIMTHRLTWFDPKYRGSAPEYFAVVLAQLAKRQDIPHLGYGTTQNDVEAFARKLSIAHHFIHPMRPDDEQKLSKIFGEVAVFDASKSMPQIVFTNDLDGTMKALNIIPYETPKVSLEGAGKTICIQVPIVYGWKPWTYDPSEFEDFKSAYLPAYKNYINKNSLRDPNKLNVQTIEFQYRGEAYKSETSFFEGDAIRTDFFKKQNPRPGTEYIQALLPHIALALVFGSHQAYKINSFSKVTEDHQPFALSSLFYGGIAPREGDHVLIPINGTRWSDRFLLPSQQEKIPNVIRVIKHLFHLDEGQLVTEHPDRFGHKENHARWLSDAASHQVAFDYLTKPGDKKYSLLTDALGYPN